MEKSCNTVIFVISCMLLNTAPILAKPKAIMKRLLISNVQYKPDSFFKHFIMLLSKNYPDSKPFRRVSTDPEKNIV